MKKFDVIIIGAGAAGLMCGIEAGKRNRRVLVLDKSNKAGKKILASMLRKIAIPYMTSGVRNFATSTSSSSQVIHYSNI